ncbi:AfsR/SARP family transcriptional regulator [Streptacidiphilus rugosus]|uniref:AfsR/SARP family transcriptional regulator n=1 Tax=Streptacidiphilus rugosus TaxID=405783 RepID=UPI0005633A13|nr:BTAD domain-containing putative transcriptional regulator [Streptacidiphilus rugosus]
MLAALLLEVGRTVTLTRLVDSVWDGSPPATGMHQIRKMVADLRRRIPGGHRVLQHEGLGYRIVLAPEQLDLSVFTVRVRRSREAAAAGLRENAVEQLRAGLDLWRGPLLSGAGGPVLDTGFAELTEARLSAVEELMGLRLELGAGPELVAELRPLAAEHPLRERLRGHLILALYRSARQAEALEEYTRLREQLADELGIDPCPELARLYADILRGNPELSGPVAGVEPAHPSVPAGPGRGDSSRGTHGGALGHPHGATHSHTHTHTSAEAAAPSSLPYDLPDFTGRRQELADLLERGEPGPRTTIICLEGMGGSGKTALAVHAAHALADRFPDGQLYIDLAGFTPGQASLDPGAALDVLLRTLNVPGDRIPDELLGRIALWRVATAQRRILLLLDNAFDAEQVRPLLPASSGSLVLITSRVRLSDLDGAQAMPVDVLTPEDSRRLLVQLLGEERVAAESEDALRLIDLCGRLPLALRISAGRLADRPRWTLAHLVERLGDEARRLHELRGGARSVAASVSFSYLAMRRELQVAFRRLGMLPGRSFDTDTAAALLGLDRYAAMEQLEDLVDVNLLGQHAQDHYACHDLVRSYARHLVESVDSAEDQQAVERLLDHYYLALTAASDQLYPGKQTPRPPGAAPAGERPEFADPDTALAWLHREQGNLVAAVRLARERGLHWHAVMLPRYLSEYLALYGYLAENLEVEQAAVAAAEDADDPVLLEIATTNLAVALWNLSRYQEGTQQAQRSLRLAVQLGDPGIEASCLSRIGLFHSQLGEFAESLRHLERAQELQRRHGGPREQAAIAVSISSACGFLGDYDRSAASAREAIRLYQGLGEVQGETLALVNLANADVGQGDPRSALGHLERAWSLSQQRRTRAYTAMVAARLTQVHLLLGDRTQARRCAGAIRQMMPSGLKPSRTITMNNVLGSVHYACAEYADARRCLEGALDQSERLDFRLGEAEARQLLALVATAEGDPEEARTHSVRARELFEGMRIPVGHIRTR